MADKAGKKAEKAPESATVAAGTAPVKTVNSDLKEPEKQELAPQDDVFGTVVKDQVGSFPEVTESYAKKVDAELKETDRNDHNHRRLKDKTGVFFDSDIHQVDEEGAPKKTVKDLWVMKRGKKRSAGKKRLRLPRNTDDQLCDELDAPQEDPFVDSCNMAAQQTACAFWAGMVAVFGKNGAPSPEEAESLPPTLESYYKSTGKIPQIPAWMPPVLIVITSVTSRLQADETKLDALKKTAIGGYLKIRSWIKK